MAEILLIEDSKLIASAIKKKIESELLLRVKWGQSYSDAIKLVKENNSNFFISLLDLYLPDAPNGEIVDFVLSKDIPSIVFTGELSDDVREYIWSKKVIDYVLKEGSHNLDYIVSLIRRISRNKSIDVLVVDDDRLFRIHLLKLLEVHKYNVFEASDGNEALGIIKDNPDIKMIITDYHMPNMDGFQLIKEVREKYSKEELAIIGIAGKGDNTLSARFIKNGANDFIDKPFVTEEFYCRVTQNIEMIEHINALRNSSNKDYLTDLYNRRYFFELGNQLFTNSKREQITITVAMIDIDYFKKINDTYGHAAGDEVLKQLSQILKKSFRESDIVSRFGGEEFCILTTNMDHEHSPRIFNGLRKKIGETSINIGFKKIQITVSIGICIKLMDSLEDMIEQADSMLYKAKEGGRNRVMLIK
ncbi:MAG: diguanylate cyclase [Spirochaetota bacterium]|nr:diguanylate cyclase [Spirochaetota bacterium]